MTMDRYAKASRGGRLERGSRRGRRLRVRAAAAVAHPARVRGDRRAVGRARRISARRSICGGTGSATTATTTTSPNRSRSRCSGYVRRSTRGCCRSRGTGTPGWAGSRSGRRRWTSGWTSATPPASGGRRRSCCATRTGGWNALHRDLYGDKVFPLQVVINLNAPGHRPHRRGVLARRATAASPVPRDGDTDPAGPRPGVHHPRPAGQVRERLVGGADAARRLGGAFGAPAHVGPGLPRRGLMPYTLIAADGHAYRSATPGTLGGHRGGRLYGRLDCPSALRAIASGGYVTQRVFFADEATAVSAGYRPCAVCLPVKYSAGNDESDDVLTVAPNRPGPRPCSCTDRGHRTLGGPHPDPANPAAAGQRGDRDVDGPGFARKRRPDREDVDRRRRAGAHCCPLAGESCFVATAGTPVRRSGAGRVGRFARHRPAGSGWDGGSSAPPAGRPTGPSPPQAWPIRRSFPQAGSARSTACAARCLTVVPGKSPGLCSLPI